MIEIEAKVKVDSLEPVAVALKDAGAELQSECMHEDAFFDDAMGKLKKVGGVLRLRREVYHDGEKVVLTFKGPKQKGQFKVRKEEEIEIYPGDIASAFKLIECLGFTKIFEYEKKRQLWEIEECFVCLDTVPLLGTFVEVEGGGDEQIKKVMGKLSLSDHKHINTGYSRLLKNKLKELGEDKNKVTFDGQ